MAINTNNMIDGSIPAPTTDFAAVAKASPGAPKTDPTTLSTQQIYSGEEERRAALAEVTALRRQFDTTTAAGAKAFANSPEAQAALARLDAAKSGVGMRTSAQDLRALNALSGRGNQDVGAVSTQALNAPSKQYFQNLYSRGDLAPTWAPPKQITEADIAAAAEKGWDYSKARYDWVWYPGAKADGQVIFEDVPGRWVLGVVGATKKLSVDLSNLDKQTFDKNLGDIWESGSVTLEEFKNLNEKFGRSLSSSSVGRQPLPQNLARGQDIDWLELTEAAPDMNFIEYQEVIYQLSRERDDDITVQDIVDKYNEIYGRG